MTRAERAIEAQRLRGEGLLYREIAERMGISLSYAAGLVSDPDGSDDRRRKDSYRGTCIDCGSRTDGSNGRAGVPERCYRCSAVANGAARKVWTPDQIIAAIQSFADEFGEPPAVADWNPCLAREQLHDEGRACRAEARDDWPHPHTVRREFGSWAGALRAAGFTPRVPHGGGENVQRRRSMRAAA